MQKEWRAVVGYEGRYEVSDQGDVRSLDVPPPANATTGQRGKRARLMKQCRAGKGYWTVVLSDGRGGQKRFYVHRMMAAAFLGLSPLDVRHLDDDLDNNRIDNLAYGTQAMNERDKIRNGNHFPTAKARCKYGHEFNADNTRRDSHGYRQCRKCDRRRQAEYLQRHRVAPVIP